MPGPTLRTDLVDCYVFRRTPELELLQLRRACETLTGTWQPVMGHIEENESAVRAVVRELAEEVGLDARGPLALGLWALEQVHPYFLPSRDAVMLTPRFACEVEPRWQPALNEEHDNHRWVPADRAHEFFMWPGQRAAIRELVTILTPGDPGGESLRLRSF